MIDLNITDKLGWVFENSPLSKEEIYAFLGYSFFISPEEGEDHLFGEVKLSVTMLKQLNTQPEVLRKFMKAIQREKGVSPDVAMKKGKEVALFIEQNRSRLDMSAIELLHFQTTILKINLLAKV